jgi:hypothetical protein
VEQELLWYLDNSKDKRNSLVVEKHRKCLDYFITVEAGNTIGYQLSK